MIADLLLLIQTSVLRVQQQPLFVSGKSRKASPVSPESSSNHDFNRNQLTVYPVKPLALLRDVVQQGENENIGKLHIAASCAKSINITGSKKNRRSLPVAVCRNCELDGSQSLKIWPRSHSMDNLQGNDERKGTENNLVYSPDEDKETTNTSNVKETEDVCDRVSCQVESVTESENGSIDLVQRAGESHLKHHEKTNLTPSSHNNLHRSSLDKMSICPTETRAQKNPSQPPPVPVKKCRERFANGLFHPSLGGSVTNAEVVSSPTTKMSQLSPDDCSRFSVQEPITPTSPRLSWLPNLPESSCIPQHAVKLEPVSARKIPCAKGMDQDVLIENKLQSEEIDLTEEPYSDKHGRCGIPESLVERYAEDLDQLEKDVASIMDQIRVRHLRKMHRMAIPSGGLTEFCRKPVSPGHIASVKDWLVSIGLPMYIQPLREAGFTTLSKVPTLSQTHLKEAGITEERHITKLLSAARLIKIISPEAV
ncbi:SAM and SH3 domain-containing protein 1-like [Rhinophrynus dorsalis]